MLLFCRTWCFVSIVVGIHAIDINAFDIVARFLILVLLLSLSLYHDVFVSAPVDIIAIVIYAVVI